MTGSAKTTMRYGDPNAMLEQAAGLFGLCQGRNSTINRLTGKMPTGETFSGIKQLNAILAKDERFYDCATSKAFTYALGRSIVTSDQPFLDQIRYRFVHGGRTVRALVKAVIASDTFRYRRGEP